MTGLKERLTMLFFVFGLLMLGVSSQLYAQNSQTVSGTVTDSQTGNPLIGVNILVKGTSLGGTTDTKGHYSLSVPSLQDTLVFSYIGYKKKPVPIDGRTTINVTMVSQLVKGQQMVVTAFGVRKKERILLGQSPLSVNTN